MNVRVTFTITATRIIDTAELAKELQGRNAKEIEKKFIENKANLENDILDALDFDTAEINTVSVEKDSW